MFAHSSTSHRLNYKRLTSNDGACRTLTQSKIPILQTACRSSHLWQDDQPATDYKLQELRWQIYELALPEYAYACDCWDRFEGQVASDIIPRPVMISETEQLLEPAFLQVALTEDLEIYREAISCYYSHTLFNVIVWELNLRHFCDYIKGTTQSWDRTYMIRHIALVFISTTEWYNPAPWLQLVKECLSPNCVIELHGNSFVIEAFCALTRVGLRYAKKGADWDELYRTLEDVHVFLEQSCGSFRNQLDYLRGADSLTSEYCLYYQKEVVEKV